MAGSKKWSQDVTDTSDALDLKPGVFTEKDPKKIARSLKDSAEHSERRHTDPYRSAMSMLTFYINRAGAQLQPGDKLTLEKAKDELRQLFQRPSTGHRPVGRRCRAGAWRSRGRAARAGRAARRIRRSTIAGMRTSEGPQAGRA